MLKSGVGITEAMALTKRTGRGRLKLMAQEIDRGLKRGESLARTMRGAPWAFPPLHGALVEAAEQTGHLPQAFDQLATQEREALKTARKFAAHMAYPLVVLLAFCFLLPIPQLVLSGGGAYAGQVLVQLTRVFTGLLLAWPIVRGLSWGFGRIIARAPGSLERAVFPGRRALFFEVLANALQSGLPITVALQLARHGWRSRDNINRLDEAATRLHQGESLSAVMASFVASGDQVILESGERSGTLQEAFQELADTYRSKAETQRKVGFILAAVFVALILLLVVASQAAFSLQDAIMPSGEQMEMLNRELKGTGLKLF